MAETEAKNKPGGSYGGKHWSQSPEGRKKMSAAQKKRFAKQRREAAHRTKPKHTERTNASSTAATTELDEGTFGYALGYVESWLGTYAAAAGVPASTLAARVGKVLHSKARG